MATRESSGTRSETNLFKYLASSITDRLVLTTVYNELEQFLYQLQQKKKKKKKKKDQHSFPRGHVLEIKYSALKSHL